MSTLIQEIGIKAWIGSVSGFGTQFIFRGDQNGPTPDGEYATFTLIRGESDNHYVHENETPDPNPTKVTNVLITTRTRPVYSVDVYSNSGRDILEHLWASRSVPPVRAALRACGITVNKKSIIRNIPVKEETSYTPRFSMDITFLAESVLNTEITLGYINELWDSFDIRGEWKKSENDTLDVVIQG